MALGLTKPDPKHPDQPLYKATKLVELYENEGGRIFPASPLNRIRQIFGPKYRPEGLEQVLTNYFGNTLLSDALTNVVIPTYALDDPDTAKGRKHIFLTNDDELSSFIYMREAARAASAAPTYFPPFRIPVPSELSATLLGKNYLTLIDGGVFANNPAPYALSIVKAGDLDVDWYRNQSKGFYEVLGRRPYDLEHLLLLLSLGTGQVPRAVPFERAWNWGLMGWSRALVDIAFSDPGVESETQDLMQPPGDYYFRLQPKTLVASTAELDNASKDNIQTLMRVTNDYMDLHHTDFDKLVTLLERERPQECQ